MTIRQYIKRRVGLGIAVFFGTGLINILVVRALPGLDSVKIAVTMVIGFLGIVGYLSVIFIRCPKCRANLGMTIAVPVAVRLFGRTVKYCPYCAVNIDSEGPHQNG